MKMNAKLYLELIVQVQTHNLLLITFCSVGLLDLDTVSPCV